MQETVSLERSKNSKIHEKTADDDLRSFSLLFRKLRKTAEICFNEKRKKGGSHHADYSHADFRDSTGSY